MTAIWSERMLHNRLDLLKDLRDRLDRQQSQTDKQAQLHRPGGRRPHRVGLLVGGIGPQEEVPAAGQQAHHEGHQENQISDDVQDVLRHLGEHGEHHVHRHEGLLLEAVSADQDDVAGKEHHGQILGPDLGTVENTPQNDLTENDAEDAQHQNGKYTAKNIVELVNAVADPFDYFHFSTSFSYVSEFLIRKGA